MASNPETVAYFDKNAETSGITDAGPEGIGAVLAHKQQGENIVIV